MDDLVWSNAFMHFPLQSIGALSFTDPFKSPWNFALQVALKKGGGMRTCSDYCLVNYRTNG